MSLDGMGSAAVAAALKSGGVESVEFLNDIVKQLWDYINVAGSQMVKDIVEPMFKEMLPGPLSSLYFKKIHLGQRPMKFANIDVHARSEEVIKLDVDILWDGDVDIELAAKMIGSFGVEGIKLKGRLSVLLCPLVERLPLVTAAQVAFINPPEIDLDYQGLAAIADFSLIEKTIKKIIHTILASLAVLPNRLLVKIDPANDYYKTYQQHLGFLRLTVKSASGFKTPKGFFKDVPDLYCKVKMGASEAWKTDTINNSCDPEWNETKDFLLSDHDQIISIEVLDDDLTGDDKHGNASITVGQLLLKGEEDELPLLMDRVDTGGKVKISCDVYQFSKDLTSLESEEHQKEGLMCGMLTILVAGASDVPGSRKELAAHCKVQFGDNKFDTPMVFDVPGLDPNNPAWDSAFRVPLTGDVVSSATEVSLALYDKKEKLGTITVPWDDVIAAPDSCLTDKYKLGNGASIHARIDVCGIILAEA